MGYVNREDAGKKLAQRLEKFKDKDILIMVLPRGGVVLGAEVAKRLKAPLGVVLVRKIGHPMYPEYAIGAVAEGSAPIYSQKEILSINDNWLKGAEEAASGLIEHRRELYYGTDFTPPKAAGKTVILVDDGIATGFTMEVAVRSMRLQKAKSIVVAVPVAAQDSIRSLDKSADEVIVLDNPENFLGAVGAHYMEFKQVSDEEVSELLREGNSHVYKTASKHGQIARAR